MNRVSLFLAGAVVAFGAESLAQGEVPLDGPALGSDRITQADIVGGALSMKDIRRKGMDIFSTPFNKLDGYGDGPVNGGNPTPPGGRPTIQTGSGATAQGNGTVLRVNGLDSQTCLECHFVRSNRTLPASFTVAGVGGFAANAFPGARNFDLDDTAGNGFAAFDGRVINPPFVFGSGGVELAAKEMTVDLLNLRALAMANPDTDVSLDTKGVNFGSIRYDSGTNTFDTSQLEGIDDDLVVKPFGRKGNNQTIRVFDMGALAFHHGMQPAEVVGDGVDADGDGVADEILVGELSALHVFSVNIRRPFEGKSTAQTDRGFQEFVSAGCADCHTPVLETETQHLPLAFPEVHTDPWANTYLTVDLNKAARFRQNQAGGVSVELFSDLKRHDMGPALAENTGDPLDPFFITPRLWGIADTAPYLHDGRALTLREAIEMHGGEGQAAADAFAALTSGQQADLLAFLGILRTPRNPHGDLDSSVTTNSVAEDSPSGTIAVQ